MSIGAIFIEDPTETVEPPVTMTAEEFMALPDDGVDRELIRGELREYRDEQEDQEDHGMTIRSRWHGEIGASLDYFLIDWLRRQPAPRARVLSGDIGFRLGGTKESLVGIDVAVVPPELLAATPEDQAIFNGPPLLAIEILSASDTLKRIAEKVELYLEWGVTTWVVNPAFRTISVHRPDQAVVTYNQDDELIGDPELPGFRLKLRELFPV
jgi:Uma2 family endonuclease